MKKDFVFFFVGLIVERGRKKGMDFHEFFLPYKGKSMEKKRRGPLSGCCMKSFISGRIGGV